MFDGDMFYKVSAELMVIDFLLLGGLNKYVALKGAFFNFISFIMLLTYINFLPGH